MYPHIPDPPDPPEVFTVGNEDNFDGHYTYYLDGSGGERSSDPRLRRCGWGAACVDFSEPDCPTLLTGRFGALPASFHSVPRAELFAAVYVLENSTVSKIRLVSDNKVFVDGSSKILSQLILTTNGDLWERYFKAKEDKEVIVVKVKSHGTDDQLITGFVNWEDFAGNSYADNLANEGAARAALPAATLLEYDSTDLLAKQVQGRLVAIICAGTTRDRDRKDAISHRQKRRAAAMAMSSHEAQDHAQAQLDEMERQLGPRQVPERLGGQKSTEIHMSHRVTACRGLYWCTDCGCFASSRGRGLLKPCMGWKTLAGKACMDRVSRGLTPHWSVKFDDI